MPEQYPGHGSRGRSAAQAGGRGAVRRRAPPVSGLVARRASGRPGRGRGDPPPAGLCCPAGWPSGPCSGPSSPKGRIPVTPTSPARTASLRGAVWPGALSRLDWHDGPASARRRPPRPGRHAGRGGGLGAPAQRQHRRAALAARPRDSPFARLRRSSGLASPIPRVDRAAAGDGLRPAGVAVPRRTGRGGAHRVQPRRGPVVDAEPAADRVALSVRGGRRRPASSCPTPPPRVGGGGGGHHGQGERHSAQAR